MKASISGMVLHEYHGVLKAKAKSDEDLFLITTVAFPNQHQLFGDLRAFVCCHDCSNPLTANWSKNKTGKKRPY